VIRVLLTGRVSVRTPAGTVDQRDLAGELGRLVLARLLLARHPVPRDVLLDGLWGDDPPRAADSVLNATLSRLRRALGTVGLDGKAVLVTLGGALQVRRPTGLTVDVETATTSVDAAEGHRRAGRIEQAWAEAVVAQAIARRPLLPGIDRIWLDGERTRLHRVHERALEVLVDVWADRGDDEQRVQMAHELVRVAPLSATAQRRLVEALRAKGDRAAAAAAARRWDELLEQELGLPPDLELRRLVELD